MMYQGKKIDEEFIDEKLIEQMRKDHRDAQAWLVKNYAGADHSQIAKYKTIIDDIGPVLEAWDKARQPRTK